MSVFVMKNGGNRTFFKDFDDEKQDLVIFHAKMI